MCGRPAGWRVLADRARLGRPGSRLPLRTSVAGLDVAAASLQLVNSAKEVSFCPFMFVSTVKFLRGENP